MDIISFTEKYLKYYNPVTGWQVGTKLQAYEKHYLTNLAENRYTITSKSRQMHVTTLLSAHVAHFLIFNTEDPRTIMFVGSKTNVSHDFLTRVRETVMCYLAACTGSLMISSYTKNEIRMSNGNVLRGTSGIPTAIKGYHSKEVIFDEAVYIDSLKDILSASLPATDSIHMVSSYAATYAYFNQLFENVNGFKKLRLHYSVNQEFFTPQKVEHLKGFYERERWEHEMELIAPPKKTEKSVSVTFRITPELQERLNRKLAETKLNISEYMRKLLETET